MSSSCRGSGDGVGVSEDFTYRFPRFSGESLLLTHTVTLSRSPPPPRLPSGGGRQMGDNRSGPGYCRWRLGMVTEQSFSSFRALSLVCQRCARVCGTRTVFLQSSSLMEKLFQIILFSKPENSNLLSILYLAASTHKIQYSTEMRILHQTSLVVMP